MLKDYILQKWKGRNDKMYETFLRCIQKQVKHISKFNTRNHYLTSKFKEEMALPDEVKQSFADSLNIEDFIEHKVYSCPCSRTVQQDTLKIDNEDFQDHMLEKLKLVTTEHYQQYESETIQEQQKIRVFNAVVAFVSVDEKTFNDQMIAIIRDDFIDERATW